MSSGRPRIALVTNLCPDYRRPFFELLQSTLGVRVYLFGTGARHYWNPEVVAPRVPSSRADTSRTGSLDVSLTTHAIVRAIKQERFDVVVKCVNGRSALPRVYAATRAVGRRFVLWTGIWHHPRTAFHLMSYFPLRYIYNRSDAICVYGHHVRRYLMAHGVAPEKVFVLGQAAPAPCAPDATSSPSIERPFFLFVGRLSPEKGLLDLLDAIALIRDRRVTLVIVGAGPQEEILRQRAADLSRVGHRVHLVGVAQGSTLSRYYADARALILPSVTTRTMKETWGFVVNEATALGTPVILTSSVGAAADGFIEDGVSGLVVNEHDPPALARAMCALLDDSALAARLSADAMARLSGISYERMVSQFAASVDYALGQSH